MTEGNGKHDAAEPQERERGPMREISVYFERYRLQIYDNWLACTRELNDLVQGHTRSQIGESLQCEQAECTVSEREDLVTSSYSAAGFRPTI
jgi:hypothetical protein